MDLLRKSCFLFLVFISCFSLSAFNVDEILDGEGLTSGFTNFLRIGIKTDVRSFMLEGDAQILDKKDKVISSVQGRFQVSAVTGGIKVGGRIFNADMIKFSSELIPLKVEDRMFRGEIEVYLKNAKLIVVNKLDIEDYVKGVII